MFRVSARARESKTPRPTVEDVAALGEGARQILGRLSLAGPRGARGRAAHLQVERLRRRHVDAVRQGRDHEAGPVAEVLVVVRQDGVADGDLRALARLGPEVRVAADMGRARRRDPELVLELGLPLER